MKFDTVNTAIQKIAQLNKLGYIVTTAVKFDDEICLHFTLLKEHNKALDTLSDKQILNMLNDKQGLIEWGETMIKQLLQILKLRLQPSYVFIRLNERNY